MQGCGRGTAFLLAVAAILTPMVGGPVSAGPTSYICTLTDYTAYNLEASEWAAKDALKTTVAIDRRTGAVIHPWLGTTSINEVRVLNPGTADWSFKLFADSGGGGHVVYIEVSEYEEGTRKSMVAIAGQIAYSGYCE